MKTLGLFLIILFSLVLESTLFRLPGLTIYVPNLVIIAVVMAGLLRSPSLALVFGLCIGFIQDMNFGTFLGETAFSYGLVGYLTGLLRSVFIRESVILGVFMTGIGVEIYYWVTYLLDDLLGEGVIRAQVMIKLSTDATISSMICMIVLYFIYHRLFARKRVFSYSEESFKV